MFSFINGFWFLLIVSLVVQHFEFRRRLGMKDRRIEELEQLLREYRDHPAGIIDVDDIRELLPEPGAGGDESPGVDLKIDV